MFCREEDKVLVVVRNAMMKTPIVVQKAVAKKSTPKSSATQKYGTGQKSTSPTPNLNFQLKIHQQVVPIFFLLFTSSHSNLLHSTRKTMNIFDKDMEGLGGQFITGGDEDNPDE
jgi:hypothetical protein